MDLKDHAKSLSKSQRRQIIMNFRELDLHKFLKELFQAMQPDYTVEITHGNQEYGKDLVIVKTDNFSKDIIGVVVKCGHINGKTLGDVDNLKLRTETVLSQGSEKGIREIKSQIEQALTHPAETKSILEDLPVSKVYVVVAGECSKNARKRLNELASEIEIFDLNWLIEQFTEFYPQIFFHGRVIDFLEKKSRELEANHRLGKSGKSLSKYFVKPLIRPFGPSLEFDQKNLKKVWHKKRLPFSELLEISKQHKKLILLGDPGTGKTGAMAKLTIDRYQNACKQLLNKPGQTDKKVLIPILLHAREFLKLESVEDLLTAYFESEETKNRFEVDLLVVDGLDEIESRNRHGVIDKLDDFSKDIGCSYILTTRKIDLINTLPGKYEKYELLPFEFNQALRLVSKLISDKNVLETITEGLERIKTQILLVPLSLLLLVELVEKHKEIPASVTELYDRFFDMALGREDMEKGIKSLFDYLVKKRFLGALAYCEFQEKNRLEIPRKDFDTFTESYANQYGWYSENLKSFVEEIERTGILELRAEVNFKHRSFLDYFAAFYIHENREDIDDLNGLITNIYFDDIWSEIAFFYIGLRREISQDLLERIYGYSSNEVSVDLLKLLGGRLLQAGWYSPAQQYIFGIKKAISYAPLVQKNFQKIIDSSDSQIPDILCDFITLTLSDLSFNSGFLERHIKELLKQLMDSEVSNNIYMAIALFWSIRRFMQPEDVKQNIDIILDRLNSFPDKEQARMLLLLTLIEEDKEIEKRIRRQVRKVGKRSPDVFKALLPAKRKGFRQ